MVGRWFIASVTAMVVVGPALVWFGGGWLAIAGGPASRHDRRLRLVHSGGSTVRPRRSPACRCRSSARSRSSSASSIISTCRRRSTSRRRDRAAEVARRHRVRGRRLLLRRARATCSTDVSFHVTAGRSRGLRRAVGRRQDHDHPARAALLRSAERPRAGRRARRAQRRRSNRCGATSGS